MAVHHFAACCCRATLNCSFNHLLFVPSISRLWLVQSFLLLSFFPLIYIHDITWAEQRIAVSAAQILGRRLREKRKTDVATEERCALWRARGWLTVWRESTSTSRNGVLWSTAVTAAAAAVVVDIQYKIANECNLTLEPSIFKVALQWCFGQEKKRRVTRLAIFVFFVIGWCLTSLVCFLSRFTPLHSSVIFFSFFFLPVAVRLS